MCRTHVHRPSPTALKLREFTTRDRPGITHWPGIGGQTYRQSALADGIDDVFVPRWQRPPLTRHRNTFIAPSEWDSPAPSVGSTERRVAVSATGHHAGDGGQGVNWARKLSSATFIPATQFTQPHHVDSVSSAARWRPWCTQYHRGRGTQWASRVHAVTRTPLSVASKIMPHRTTNQAITSSAARVH